MKNSTNLGPSFPSDFTFCVPDCKLAKYNLVNDDVTHECMNCGQHCASCNSKTGCESCAAELPGD